MPNLTKAQLIQNFSVMDTATLNKLYTYSQMLIIPDQDLLVNATKAQMEAWIVANAPSLFSSWTAVGNKADFGWFLCELFSLFSEKDFWYINAFANEALLKKSHVYSFAFTKAVSLGYDPVVCKGASALFNVVFPPGSTTVYARGQLVISLPNSNLQFSNDQVFSVAGSANAHTVPLTLLEGKQAASVVSFNGKSVLLTAKNIDVESLDVVINNVDWRRVRTFGESSGASTDYIALPEQDGSASIEFGDDGFGVRPNVNDSISAYYRTCLGSGGNTAIQTAAVSSSNAALPPLSVLMASAATGGTDAESLQSVKNNAILYFSSKRAAINNTVAEKILNTYPGVKQSNVYTVGPVVNFQVIPTDGSIASSALLSAIQAFLAPLLMLGYSSTPKDTTYVNVAPLSLTISILAGFDVPTTVSLVQQLVSDYCDPLVLAVYGGGFDLSALALLIKAEVPGVQNVIFNEVAGTVPANIAVANNAIIKPLGLGDLTVTPIAA